jgi:hypothetical protein
VRAGGSPAHQIACREKSGAACGGHVRLSQSTRPAIAPTSARVGQHEHTDENLTGLQIGWVDVDPERLREPGSDLDGVLDRLQPADLRFDLDAFPRSGWRQIEDLDRLGIRRHTCAAPHPAEAAGWSLLTAARNEDRWIISGDPCPSVPIRGRAARRRDLRLRWPEEAIIAPAGSVPQLTIRLHNVGNVLWVGGDGPRTVAWITDLAGERLPAATRYAYRGVAGELRIEPGESIPCTVALLTEGVQLLPAGDYGLQAILVDLNLKSNRGALRLT